MLHHHNVLVGVEFEPAPDDEQRRIQAAFIRMRRRNRFEYMANDRTARRNRQRALQWRLNRKRFKKTILMGLLIGES